MSTKINRYSHKSATKSTEEKEESVKMTMEDATIVSDSESISESMSDSDEESSDDASNSSHCSTCDESDAKSVNESTGTSEDNEDNSEKAQEVEPTEVESQEATDGADIAAVQRRLSEAEYRLAEVATIAEEVEAKLLARVTSFDERLDSEMARIDELIEENSVEHDEYEDKFYKVNEETEQIKKSHSELEKRVEGLWGKKQNPGNAIEDKKAYIKILEAELQVKKEELREQLMKEIDLLDSFEGVGRAKVTTTRAAESQGGNGVGKKARKA